MVDPIADMFNRIKNAQAVQKDTVEIPFSQNKESIAKILEAKGFVQKIEVHGRGQRRTLELGLKYEDKIPVVSGVKKISKPGQRIYSSAYDLKKLSSKRGITIISTSKGFMTTEEARKEHIGGEVVATIW